MSIHLKAIAAVIIVLALIAGCGKGEPSEIPAIHPTTTAMPRTATSVSPPATAVPIPPTATPAGEATPQREAAPTIVPPLAAPPLQGSRGTIAFDGNEGIYVIDVAAALDSGSDSRRLLIEDAFGAAWSPDGSQIAFASGRDSGRMGIFVMDADGGEPRRLTDDTLGGLSPTWSPDGAQIAFVTDQGGNWDLYVINADGSDPRRLTDDRAIDGHPQWSPDGAYIAFTSERSGNPDVYVLNVAGGGEPVNLTQNDAVDAAPDWSPDGSQIVFYSNRGGEGENIYVMDRDGSNVTQLTASRADDWHPAWSPDGSQIAFVSFRSHQDGDADIYVIDLAGGPESEGNRPQRLTYSPAHDENPTWRPLPPAPSQETADGQVINAETVALLERVADLDLPDSFVNTIVFSPDSRTMITGDRNGEVLLWDCETWERTTYLPARSSRAADSAAQIWFWGTLALSPDGETVVTAYGDDGAVTGRDRAGQELFAFSYGARVYSVAASPDGQFLAVGGLQSTITIFDLAARQLVADLSSDHERVLHLGFSPDGKILLVNYHLPEHIFTAWDTATWQETETFRIPAAPGEYLDYHDVLFSPEGKELVIASTERVEIKFVDLASKEIVREFTEHTRAPYQMAFSPDGSLLASAGDDGTLRLWDLQTNVNVKTIWNRQESGAVAFSPDGTLIAFSLWGRGVQVWAVASATNPMIDPTPEPESTSTALPFAAGSIPSTRSATLVLGVWCRAPM